jgi:glyoxylase-like metal-dependent hydrolase (beta-lactamase superfamily II)
MARSARNLLTKLKFQIETVDKETEVIPGVRVIPAPGHTPGHVALLIASRGEALLNLGDAAVHPIHLEYPELENGSIYVQLRPLTQGRNYSNAPLPGICV